MQGIRTTETFGHILSHNMAQEVKNLTGDRDRTIFISFF